LRAILSFVAAIRFLTIVPAFPRREATAEEIGRSIVYFPLVGLGIGAALFGLDRLFALFLPNALGSALVIVALVVITGAHHLDGLIDTCDGMAAGRSPRERLEIMRDSHAGSFGIIGAFVILLLLYLSLLILPSASRMAALILMPTLSRWAMVYAIFAHPYARETGMGQAFKQQANWQRLAVATALALAASLIFMRLWGLALVAAVLIITVIVAWFLRRKLGGLTGDTYGAINEVIEVSVLILVPLFAGGYFYM